MQITGPFSRFGMAVALAALASDQLQKFLTIELFRTSGARAYQMTPFFDVVMAWNTGISYGLFKQESELGRWVLIATSAVVLVALMLWLGGMTTRFQAAALGLIIGGAAGNMIDRIRFGAVADFFAFHAFGFHWYIFNLADTAIVTGVAGLLYAGWKSGHKTVQNQT